MPQDTRPFSRMVFYRKDSFPDNHFPESIFSNHFFPELLFSLTTTYCPNTFSIFLSLLWLNSVLYCYCLHCLFHTQLLSLMMFIINAQIVQDTKSIIGGFIYSQSKSLPPITPILTGTVSEEFLGEISPLTPNLWVGRDSRSFSKNIDGWSISAIRLPWQ